jgi:hypothetical protein
MSLILHAGLFYQFVQMAASFREACGEVFTLLEARYKSAECGKFTLICESLLSYLHRG